MCLYLVNASFCYEKLLISEKAAIRKNENGDTTFWDIISWSIFLPVFLPWLIEKFRLRNKVKKAKNKKIIWVMHSETFLEFHEDYFCDQ